MKIGQAVARSEDAVLLRGEGMFTADLPPAPDEVAMVIVRAQVAAGRLVCLDTTEAAALPGVVAVLTARDLRADGIGWPGPRAPQPAPDGGAPRLPEALLLAEETVCFVGQPLAVVLAQTHAAAREAADLIAPEIEARAAVTDAAEALLPEAPRVWPQFPDNRCFVVHLGDQPAVAAAMAAAPRVVARRLRVSRVTAAALEPRAARAVFDPQTGTFAVETSSSSPARMAQDLAPVLGVAPEALQIRVTACGGSFGMKNAGTVEVALAAWAARRLARPVRWVAGRLESFLGDPQGRDQWIDARLALDHEGRFLAFEAAVTANLGALAGPATLHPPVGNLGGLAGMYRTPLIAATVTGVFTNTQHTAPYRGAGRPEATYAIEMMIDAAAAEMGIDRAELRRRNLITPAQMPFRTGLVFTYDCGDFPAVLERALAMADWQGHGERRAAARARGRLRGIGLACAVEIAGGPANRPNAEFAGLTLLPEGGAQVVLGSCDSGQGHATAFRQVLADRLGLDPAAIEITGGDPARAPGGLGTFGSRTAMAAGTALWRMTDRLLARLTDEAADLLEAAAPDLVFEAGWFTIAGTDRRLALTEVLARRAAPITAAGLAAPEGATFPNGCHVCEVEIDPETGQTELCSYVVVDDVGTVLNPLIVKGQITGGVVQGLGQALGEAIVHDPASGQLLTASFMDYTMPRATALPRITIASHPVPTATNPLGVKGVGEAGTVGALSAVMSALNDALAQAGAGPVQMPATPARVWAALQAAPKPDPRPRG